MEFDIPVLPTELVDILIASHHHDERTLSSCSLVCRSWLELSRRYRFANVMLNRNNVRCFLELSEWTLESVRLRICKLSLALGSTSHLIEPVMRALSESSALVELQMYSLDPFIEFLPLVTSAFMTVTQLRVSGIQAATTESITTFLSALPMLETFWLEAHMHSLTGSGIIRLPHRLRSFCLNAVTGSLGAILESLMTPGSLPPLCAVHLEYLDKPDQAITKAFLDTIRDSLRHGSFISWSLHQSTFGFLLSFPSVQ